MFITVGFIFGIFGLLINIKLKQNFSQFYSGNIGKLLFSAIGLTVPIMIRGVLDVAAANKTFHNWVLINQEWYQWVFYIVGSFLPFCSQFLSLIFGIIRITKDKQNTREHRAFTNNLDMTNEFGVDSSFSRESKISSRRNDRLSRSSFFHPPLEDYIQIVRDEVENYKAPINATQESYLSSRKSEIT